MVSNDLESVLHYLGIDPSEQTLAIISQLMNCTLQCLGAIRVLTEKLERDRVTNMLSALEENQKFERQKEEHWAVKKAFSFATNRMVHEIMRGEEIHNLNPARHLIESFPNSAIYCDSEWLAVHWTILGEECYDFPYSDIDSTGTSEDKRLREIEQIQIINHLANIYPHSFKALDKENRSVLHIAARLESIPIFNVVLSECQRVQGATIRDVNSNGALPLHNAARFCKSYRLFKRVEEEYPEALRIKNNEGMLPLHWAAGKNQSVAIIEHLIQVYPECIRIPNNEGYLPLHLAGQNDCLEVVQAVYEAYPEAIQIFDLDGGLPIHHACSITKNLAVVQFLNEKNPTALLHPQEHGITPLHLAASQNDVSDLFQFILDQAPTSPTIRDAVGCLPLDCFIMRLKYGISISMMNSLRVLLRVSQKVLQNTESSAEETLFSDYENEVIQRADAISRLYLSMTHRTHPLLYTLNRMARRIPIFIFIQLSRITVMQMSGNNAENSLSVYRLSMLVVRRLAHRFLSPESLEIPPGILRIIISYF